MTVTLNSSQVQQNFGAALDRALRGDDVIIERYGTPRAAILEYGRYQKLVAVERTLAESPMAPPPVTGSERTGAVKEAPAPYRVDRSQALTPEPGIVSQETAEFASSVEAALPAYRYVTRSPGVCGGQPVIQGTRVPVRAIVGYHKLGLSVDEILAGLPHLTPAQVHEALSYYYDHLDEIEQEIQANQLERLIERYGLQVAADGRITIAS